MDNWKIVPVVVENENTIIRNKLNSFLNLENSNLPVLENILA